VFESLHGRGCDHHHDSGDGFGEWDLAEQYIGGGLYDRGEYSNVFSGIGNLCYGANGDDLGYDCGRDDLLHDQWIVSDDFVNIVFESMFDHGFYLGNG
jgi:hypothetical protein